MRATDEMLEAAMKSAVKNGMLPEVVDEDTYLKNWQRMKAVLDAALSTL